MKILFIPTILYIYIYIYIYREREREREIVHKFSIYGHSYSMSRGIVYLLQND